MLVSQMTTYCMEIYRARYFWTHLAFADIRSRWRRSFLGVAWSVAQPLGLTMLMAVVFGKLFKQDIVEYVPYILSGVITWDFFVVSLTSGSLSFVQADAYIKQYRHPLAIYTLRTTLTNLMVLMMASLSLFGWALIAKPHFFGWSWLASILIFPLAALIVWPLATSLAYVGVRFRDLPHALSLVLTAMYFVSPIYFDARLFQERGLGALVDYNPMYHLLEIVRAPLLAGKWPTAPNFATCGLTIFGLSVLAALIGRTAERKVIFYL
ncbi:ABC transporter permease (plasmid) [Bradyrhizobium japonicum]|jgi:lipopolysaccharide transport system permease protein|uniref:Transport permease protein n=2 Tax=Bradyrhizobium barranii subsp. barranii TaxID=2823807 RepID=A0A9X9YE50_9BRAD|nr:MULTISPECIES: ABC transporter permease [Bradyrhizobium]MCD9825375.1 ABC transporter permease [Bradyrhizobium japonicum]MCD9898336.1 ABC transporter permease [Bradyrhizobium japonicum]MCP1748941.1 lipopolysaccharide transport system permease protein [Bradyrhizobium japonicum]MCP1784521.1 lipopolysaccharide transport system permease protein [Bradyrhizobium japonicum]MCP1866435.1 lipopolysaccharide transport system permease protein [Bradyrhizobium japonicum]